MKPNDDIYSPQISFPVEIDTFEFIEKVAEEIERILNDPASACYKYWPEVKGCVCFL